ncbi:hypothetical protein QBC32DRAFT_373864 [Pseudoneurospora amorphoporcata]|uniref:MYND-type domain-containing protein n=1 Tax=Pseudoneurospora amorphoporcata TaxID=241081 RepID=A0AAN6NQK4_9PEZI|nr:hypothetical protein QBC32DRAFT_373864 [Pseudoneurospora amorphoporcata]
MLTPVGTGVLRYSYPMGDTPAVCLTQDIPPSFRVPVRSRAHHEEEGQETEAEEQKREEQDGEEKEEDENEGKEKKEKENEKSQKDTDNGNNQEEDLINILLLGCGDLRKILFTIHHDAGRRLDITCCDNERSIIARNILLLTLLIDMDSKSQTQPSFPLSPIHDLFPIYYHFYVTPRVASLVASQARKLSSDAMSSSLQAWHASTYGLGGLRFCDSHSLLRVREIWQCWARFNDDGDDDGDGDGHETKKAVVTDIKAKFQANLAATREMKTDDERVDNTGGRDGLVYTAIRSAAPAAALLDVDMPRHLNELHWRFWKFGRISSFHDTRAANKAARADKKEDTRVNPMFVTPESDGHVRMHWGLDPLLGFPLAEAYVRTEDEPEIWAAEGLNAQTKVLSLAMGTFAHWCQSFQQAWGAAGRRSGVVMRWFVGDAIAFGHSLQGLANTRGGIRKNSHWYHSRHGFLSLVLDGEDYNMKPGTSRTSYPAPLSFMVIDTSNLTDDLGALNVLIATSPLLKNNAAATIYTEMLTRYHRTYKQEADNLLCGPLSTVGLLLGDMDDGGAPERRSNHKLYTPASFAAFLKFIKSRAQVDDWTVTIEAVLALIEQEPPRQPHGDSEPVADYTPELRAWLHLFGVYKLEWNRLVPRWERLWQLRTWKSIPPVMCVTVVVPQEALPKVGRLEMENLRLGRPSFVECAISKPGVDDKSCHGFAAVQVGYGWPQNSNTRIRGPGSIFIVDPARAPGLEGECHLLVSFMVPTSVLLRDGKTSTVKVQFRRTPSTADYEGGQGGLGPGLTIYETPLHNYDQVVITQYMPKQRGIPTLHEFPTSVPPPDLQARTTIVGSIANTTGKITSLAARIRFTCPELNSRLANGYTARCRVVSPCAFLITLKGTPTARLCNMNSTKSDEPVPRSIEASIPQGGRTWESTFTFSFPLLSDVTEAELVTGPVSPANNFIELTVPVIRPENFRRIATASPSWIYPAVLPLPLSSPPVPISWSIPYLPCIDKLPVIDLEKIRKSSEPSWDGFKRWLDNYTRIYSDWEHRYMNARASVQENLLSAGESSCLHWKKMVRAMFMLFAGAAKRQITFVVCRKGQMRVEMVFYMSCVRLDMANRCLVLDGAVLVRTAETSRLMDVLEKMFKDGDVLTLASLADAEARIHVGAELDTKPIVCYFQTTPDAIQMWKEILPAYVERCRTWEHDPERCEYVHRAGETGVVSPMDVDEDESSVLCSCGNGQLPDNERVPSKVWEMIKRRLVRVAISPPFGCAFVEKPYLPEDIATVNNQAPPPPPPPRGPPKAVCRNCKREKRKDGGELDQTCPVCGGMKYCSRNCQRADSRRHKKEECPRGKGKKK